MMKLKLSDELISGMVVRSDQSPLGDQFTATVKLTYSEIFRNNEPSTISKERIVIERLSKTIISHVDTSDLVGQIENAVKPYLTSGNEESRYLARIIMNIVNN